MKRGIVLESILIMAVLACGPGRSASTANQFASAAGTATFGDKLATADEISVRMTGVPALRAGQSLQGWLVGADGKTLASVGPLQPAADGSVSFRWDSPTSENLLGHYVGFQATVETGTAGAAPKGPVAFSGTLPTAGRSLFGGGASSPNPSAVGLKEQTDLAVDHGDKALAAMQIKAWDEMRAHLEHVINILEGQQGKRYGDYLGTGVPQNPGDGYGVQLYEKDVVGSLGTSGALASDLDKLDKSFQSDMNGVEEVCLSVLSLKNPSKAPALMANLKPRLTAFHDGPVADLYGMAQKELSIVIGPPRQ